MSTANTGLCANTTSPSAAPSPATTYFGPDGRVREYVSLESADAARTALTPSPDVIIGATPRTEPVIKDFALNYYTGKSHGTIKLYPKGEPRYEHVRADLIRWLRNRAAHASN
jgi:hypothetical protein